MPHVSNFGEMGLKTKMLSDTTKKRQQGEIC